MANGIVFFRGKLIAVGAGPSNGDVEFGELQDISFEGRDTTKEAFGPTSIFPLASELVERNTSLRASYLRINAQGLALLTGGTVTYADNKTTIAVGKTSLPTSFKAKLTSPADGSDIELILYKVEPQNFSLGMALRDFTIPNFECRVLVADEGADADKIYDIILPGYQSVN
ncbi:hypothetical protein LLG39_12595 [bacterium]|nr:hypothetical protein [bacterium]